MRESLNKDKRESSLRGRGNPGAAAVNNGNREKQFLFQTERTSGDKNPARFRGINLIKPAFTTLPAYDPLNNCMTRCQKESKSFLIFQEHSLPW